MFETTLSQYNLALSDVILIGLVTLAIIFGIDEIRQSRNKLHTHEIDGKIKHIQGDLLPAYRRLIGLETEEKENKLVFMVNPLYQDHKRNQTFDEAYQDVWEREHMPKTPLEVLTNGGSALEHLKHKDYKDTYQHFKKAKDLVEKFNQNHDESLKPQINESIRNFKMKLVHLIDRLDNNHLMKGKCLSCP